MHTEKGKHTGRRERKGRKRGRRENELRRAGKYTYRREETEGSWRKRSAGKGEIYSGGKWR